MVMTVVAAVLIAGLACGCSRRRATTGVPSKTQAFAELTIDWLGNQVKDIYHGPSTLVAPIALTTGVLVLLLNAMDWLPIDVMAWFYEHVFHVEHWRNTPTADVNTTFALALSVFALMIFYSIKVKGLGGWLHELIGTPFGLKPLWASPLLILRQPHVPDRRVRVEAAVALAAAVRQHVRGRDHLPVVGDVGGHGHLGRVLGRLLPHLAGPAST